MSTPSTFYLEPANPALRPAPCPPRFLKRQIYNEPSVFKHIDDHSINEARTNYRNFRDLMWNLIFKKHWNELEKARAIFRWMTTKNLYTIMFDSELPGSPEQVIGAFKDGKTTYAKIFECLCVYSGLHCVTLSGWAKGVDYKPGMPITSTPPNHSWNAVYIDGNWQLVDCHWATRYLQSERNTPENLVYEYDDFYFLTEPGMLVYSHCPEETSWQLLHPAKSRTEYEEFPLVKSFFFSIGMQFLQQNRGIVFTKRGIVTITLGFTQPTAFTFKLALGETGSENLQGFPLKRYVIQETTENRVTFYFRSPREGNYYITVFAQQVFDRIKIENVFKAACEYKIICDAAAADIRPFPLCSDANWGVGAPVRQYGLTASHTTALLAAPNGRADVSFIKTRDVRLFARLVKDGMSEDVLENAVNIREQDNQVFVTVQLPTVGEYGLEVYANEPLREGDTYTHVCQYLCAFTDRDFGTLYGQVYDRADLAYGMQAGPMTYNAPAGQYATLPPGQGMRGGPGQLMSGPPGSRPMYGTQERDGTTAAGRTYRDEMEPGYDGSPMYRQQTGPMASRPDMGPGGKKVPPGTAPKPYGAGQVGYGDDFPHPPADLMNQSYQQQQQRAPGGGDYTGYGGDKAGMALGSQQTQPNQDDASKKPLEIVYVTNITEKAPTAGRKQQEDEVGEANKNRPPIEVVYVGGGSGRSPMSSRKGETLDAGGDASQKPESLFVQPKKVTGVGDASPSQSPSTARKGDKNEAVRSAALAGSRLPSGAGGPSQEQVARGTGVAGSDRDEFPAPPPGVAYTSGKAGQPGYGQDQRPYGGLGGPKPYSKGGDQKPYGTEQGAPEKKQTAAPVGQHYPFGGDVNEEDSFGPSVPTEPEQEYNPHPQKVYTSSITINPPASFRPIPIQQQDPTPKPAPPAVPPKPFKDTSVFQNVDTHAVEVSKEEHRSFRDLVWHLIYAREITNELEKARAIFLWLCSKDLTKLNFDTVQKGSPEEILMNLQRGQTTYAVVFEILCSYAGLHCKTISGYAKGAEYKPGMKFVGEQGQHSWNAVLVNNAWRLVDCHWAARRLVGKKVTAENVRYELDEYYFMPDPHQLIFTHFPDEVGWQLLERSISLADFENLVPVKSAFFKYGLQILGHREAVICTQQEVTIRIGCPPFKANALAFTFTLAYDNGKEEFQGVKLNRFGMQEMVENVSYFTIRPPEKSSYRLIIYAKDLDQQTKEGVYGGVCEYELKCESNPPRPLPFPPCVHTSWGPGDSAAKYSLTPLQKGAIFCTVNGLAEVRFRMPKELRFTAKVKSNDRDEKALAGYVMNRVVGDMAVFTFSAPARGEYGLEIYANDPEIDGNSLYHAYQYLIICTESIGTVEPLPTLPPGYLGAQASFRKLGLSCATHEDPYIHTASGDLQVTFATAVPVRMTSQLLFVSGGRSDDSTDYVLQQSRGSSSVTFQIKLPKPGLYKLQVYGLPFSDPSENLPGVYNYLINCTNTYTTLTTFPKQYGQWKEGCFLHEPLEGHLQQNRASKGLASSFNSVYFKVDVPKANSVAVVVGEEWTQLEQKSTGTSTWEGEVNMEKRWGHESKVALCANFGNVKASYSTLLEYSM
jgi:hypothetical protein